MDFPKHSWLKSKYEHPASCDSFGNNHNDDDDEWDDDYDVKKKFVFFFV
jgi:hypothetical protein